MYIESPNKVTFNGNFNLQGFIVMEAGASTTDSLTFKGNLTMSPVPNQAAFNAVSAVSGVAVLAKSGNVDDRQFRWHHQGKHCRCNTFDFQGTADLQIDLGSLMTLSGDSQFDRV